MVDKSWMLNTHTHERTHAPKVNEIWNWPWQWIESYYTSAGLNLILAFCCYPEKVDTWQFQNVKFSHFNALTCFRKAQTARYFQLFFSLFRPYPCTDKNNDWSIWKSLLGCIPPKYNQGEQNKYVYFWKLKNTHTGTGTDTQTYPNWMWMSSSVHFFSKCSFCIQMSVKIIEKEEDDEKEHVL